MSSILAIHCYAFYASNVNTSVYVLTQNQSWAHNRYFVTFYRYSIHVDNDQLLESTNNNVPFNDLVLYF
jgi:hypothetical protein